GWGRGGVANHNPVPQTLNLTLHIDLQHPRRAPGTGTPAMGGLMYEELRDCLEELLSRHNLVAFDLVEVAPAYDSSQITAEVASQLIIDILSARFPPA
ncbi:MAG: arginase, partial [Chloroflexi bacterium]|nr:arginase [Chloroflexota bacterium]